MSWKETCPMTERMHFLSDVLRAERSLAELCDVYGISRKTGYKWLDRYRAGGLGALQDRSHAPLHPPHPVPQELVERLVQMRRQHPSWGPRKLLARLEALGADVTWPAASTVGEILRRHGLVQPRRRHARANRYAVKLVQADAPNMVWCADFKGQFRTQDGRYCYPLTVSDAFSRYLLECRAVLSPSTEQTWGWFERTFRQYGLPTTIRTDNGSPFASTGLLGISRLAAWWIKLGIVPERIQPGCPQQNGRHERMHRTLKNEATRPAAANLKAQQKVFDRFVREFNHERPHEALGQRTPSVVYRASSRAYPSRIAPPEYPDSYEVRKVRYVGDIKVHGRSVYVSEALIGELVGLDPIAEDLWCLYFGLVPLGLVNGRTGRIEPITANSCQVRGAAPPAPPLA
jgi:putative transposase